jgi:hypothetical protein
MASMVMIMTMTMKMMTKITPPPTLTHPVRGAIRVRALRGEVARRRRRGTRRRGRLLRMVPSL